MCALRVVHVITKLELGGAQQNTLYTASHLNPSIFEAHLICGTGGMLDADAAALQSVSVHFRPELVRQIRPWSDWQAYHAIRKVIGKIKPDIVHTHSSKAGLIGRAAAHAENVPAIIHTYHGFGFHRFQNPLTFRAYLEAERRACRWAHHLIFVSRENWQWAEDLKIVQNRPASLIRSGVKPDSLLKAQRSEAFRSKLGIPKDAFAIGMIGCLKPQKDPLTFLEAADLVMDGSEQNVYFLLAGDGVLRNAVLKRKSRMKHSSRFLFLGWRRDIPEILANLDLVILTSLWEGLPRVIPEASIAGVPVIASNIDGNREVIFENRNGTLAEPRNAKDFAEKISRAVRQRWKVDSALSLELQREFDIDEMVRQQEELYLTLAVGSRPNVFAS